MAGIKYAYLNDDVYADEEYEIYLYFDSLSEADDSRILRCHLYDSQFSLEYNLDDVTLASLQSVDPSWSKTLVSNWNNIPSPDSCVKVLKMKFPSHLAGGTFRMDFYLQPSGENSLEAPKHYPTIVEVKKGLSNTTALNFNSSQSLLVDGNCFSVNLNIKGNNGKKMVSSVCWGENEDIEYGKNSPCRQSTTVHKNEKLYVHIHTEGMYGSSVELRNDTNNNTEREIKILDNVAVCTLSAANLVASSGDKICQMSVDKTNKLPSLSYDNTEVKLTAPPTSMVYVTTGANTDSWEKLSDASCRVDFRPEQNTYDGTFGFSWYRVGDTNTENSRVVRDCSFLENLGYHYDNAGNVHQDPNNGYKGSFMKDPNMINKHIWEYRRIRITGMEKQNSNALLSDLYLIPQMTIRKGKSVHLSLNAYSKQDPQEYVFEFSNPEVEKGGYLSVQPKSYSFLMSGMVMVQVECHKEFSKPVYLNVYAYGEKGKEESRALCGSLRILPNDVMHQRNVNLVVVNVRYKIKNASGYVKTCDGLQMTNITFDDTQKLYDQAYVNVNVENVTIDLDDPNDPVVNSYVAKYGRLPFDNYIRLIHDKTVFDYLYACEGLYRLLQELVSFAPINNRSAYVLVMLPMAGKSNNGFLGGVSLNGKNFTVCFAGCDKHTPAHELGHALGLPHTFTGCTSAAKYVYRYSSTDNIMDYSHLVKVKPQSFFHWQWKTINALME